MECPTIAAVFLKERTRDAHTVQEVFTRFGSAIRVRLGVHATDRPSDQGLILLQLCCGEDETQEFIDSLNRMPRVRAQAMKVDLD